MKNYPYITAEEAVQIVKSGDRVFSHGSASTPVFLLNKLLARAGEINDIELVSISTFGDIEWEKPGVTDSFYLNSLFVSANVRKWANSASGRYVPIFLSEIPILFSKGYLPLDVAIVQVSPPDQHGYCSLGTSVDAAWSAVRNAKKVIAQVNPKVPRTLGDSAIHHSNFEAMVWHETELPTVDYGSKATDITNQIGENVAELIEDGSTIQAGIGAIPDAVLNCLSNHKNLGIHTEMFSDGVVPLIESGVVNNEHKTVSVGKTVTSFVAGTKRVYDFVDNNPNVSFKSVSFVNDTAIIRQNPKMI